MSDTIGKVERKHMSIAWRIWEVSIANCNNWGHAAFRPGELVRLVCGDNSDASAQAVRRGLKTLVEMGRIMPRGEGDGSTMLCVMLNSKLVERAAGKGKRLDLCSEPAHRDTREAPWPPKASKPDEPVTPDNPWAPPTEAQINAAASKRITASDYSGMN